MSRLWLFVCAIAFGFIAMNVEYGYFLLCEHHEVFVNTARSVGVHTPYVEVIPLGWMMFAAIAGFLTFSPWRKEYYFK